MDVARELVAIVSSCLALPWMIDVNCSLAFCVTRFQTLITSPQVVSTNWQPLAFSLSIVATSAPNAGMITTSFSLSSSMSALLIGPERNLMPIARICSLTSGLWMISPKM